MCNWLGHKITSTVVTPLVRKTEPIKSLKPPRTLLQLKSSMGSIHYIQKEIPVLAENSAPLRSLLSKNNDHIWTTQCLCVFESLKKQVTNIVELRHFDVHKVIRIVSEANHNNIRAILEPLGTEDWRLFASRHLSDAKKSTQRKI